MNQRLGGEGESLKKYARVFMCVSDNYKIHSFWGVNSIPMELY